MNIVIVGCGRFGQRLIQELNSFGDKPFIIAVDQNEQAFADLSFDFKGFTLVHDTQDLSLLETVKITTVDVLLAVTDQPNLNFMLAHIAQEIYQVPQVFVRVPFDEKSQSFEGFGLKTINPLADAAKKLVASIN